MSEQVGYVKTNIHQGVGEITFYHPSHNALPGNLLARLANAIEDAGQDVRIQVIVLKSEGDRTFCAGASFDELLAISDEQSGKAFFMGFANVINACRTCPKLIIGRIQGKAVGGGVGLASAVDYCVATKYAAIKLSELAVGIGPFVVGPAVERKLGLAAFSQLAIDARSWQNAYWARDKGLYTEVFDSIEAMDNAIDLLCQNLTDSSITAMTELKKVLWQNYTDWDSLLESRAAISGRLVLSSEAQSAIQQFKNKA